MNIKQIPASPSNYTVGRGGKAVSRIVIHVMDGSMGGTAAWFANPASHVSAHYGVGSGGEVVQYVADGNTAYQAGNWEVNQTTLGVEHEGRPAVGPWAPTEAQLQASAALVASLCKRYNIAPTPQSIVPHSSINPQHHCPGPTWPWARYLGLVQALLTPKPAHVATTADKQAVRIFDPATNEQIGTGSLIAGTDKVYLTPKS